MTPSKYAHQFFRTDFDIQAISAFIDLPVFFLGNLQKAFFYFDFHVHAGHPV